MAYTLPRSALYAFQLPQELLAALQPRQLVIPTSHPLHPANRQPEQETPEEEAPLPETARPSGRGAYTCALTGASFSTLDGLKQHYRTDWYRYNVKLKLQGKKVPVSEQDFNRLIESEPAPCNSSLMSSPFPPGGIDTSALKLRAHTLYPPPQILPSPSLVPKPRPRLMPKPRPRLPTNPTTAAQT